MIFATAGIASATGVLSSLPTTSAPDEADVRQLAGDLARLALDDPAHAVTLVRDLLWSTPASANAGIATSVSAHLDDGALDVLAGTPAGRELLEVLDRGHAQGLAGADSQAQLDRLRAALHSAPHSPTDWARMPVQQALQPGPAFAASLTRNVTHLGAGQEQVKSAFKQEFAAKAADKQGFDSFMQRVFGDQYDKGMAEQFRQRGLAGDFSWLPEVKFVDAQTLGGANGAYNAEEGVVYINRDLTASDPGKAAQTFVEEAGHHLDAKLNKADTQGDEGEMFRRVLGGEQLSAQQVAAIRNENDKGTITVDGKQVEVEFWNPLKAASDGLKAVGGAISDGAKAVGGAISDGAEAVGGAVSDGAKSVGRGVEQVAGGVWRGAGEVAGGIGGALKDFGQGLMLDAVGGFFGNLFDGNIGDAFDSVVRGIDRGILQSSERLLSGAWKGLQEAAGGITDMLGPIGKPIRWVTDRLFDIGHTALDTVYGVFRDAYRMVPELFTGFVGDIERAVEHATDGDWGKAAGQLGMAFVNIPGRVVGTGVDIVARMGQGLASVGQTATGLEPPARGLSGPERDYLKKIYGDSIDYDMIRVKPGGALNNAMEPHTVGNTIYLPKGNFNPDGTLTRNGLITLGHEVGHVWQNQNGGGDYIHGALGAQAEAGIVDGDWTGAYDWRAALREGKTFETMNQEQRARVMEDIGIALNWDGTYSTMSFGTPGRSFDAEDGLRADAMHSNDPQYGTYTSAELAFLRDVAEKLKHGQGAG